MPPSHTITGDSLPLAVEASLRTALADIRSIPTMARDPNIRFRSLICCGLKCAYPVTLCHSPLLLAPVLSMLLTPVTCPCTLYVTHPCYLPLYSLCYSPLLLAPVANSLEAGGLGQMILISRSIP